MVEDARTQVHQHLEQCIDPLKAGGQLTEIAARVTSVFGTVPAGHTRFTTATQASMARRSFDVSRAPFYRRGSLSRAVYMSFYVQHWSSDVGLPCFEEWTEKLFQKYFNETLELAVIAFIYRILMLCQPRVMDEEDIPVLDVDVAMEGPAKKKRRKNIVGISSKVGRGLTQKAFMHRLQPIVRAERLRAMGLYGDTPVGVTIEEVRAEMTPEGGFDEQQHTDNSQDEDATSDVAESDKESDCGDSEVEEDG